ncbi:MAG: hypothetical protein ACI8WT_001509 [Clostridium sp.]|jgi:hypothetical protein
MNKHIYMIYISKNKYHLHLSYEKNKIDYKHFIKEVANEKIRR